MIEEKTFPTVEACEKLKDAEKHIPLFRGSRFMGDFCAYLGERLAGSPIAPIGFVTAYLLVVEDAKSGKDGFTGNPMPVSLTGQPPMLYNLLMSFQTQIAEAVFGAEFGDLVAKELAALEKD
jgi:hypothetical protein